MLQKNQHKSKINDESLIVFAQLIDNIKEIDFEKKKEKRNNSFNCSNIFQNNKHVKNNKIVKQKYSKDINNKNNFKLISHLKKEYYEESIHKSFSSKSFEKLEKIKNKISIGKGSNLSFRSFQKTNKFQNFILKSDILKLTNKEKQDHKDNKNIYKLLTQRTKEQEKFNRYQFFLYSNENGNNDSNKKNIISNTYIDNEEENEEIKEHINNIIESRENNNIDLFNYYFDNNNNLSNNYHADKDSNKELYSMKNIYQSNLNINNIKSQISNINYNNNFDNNNIKDHNLLSNENKIHNNIFQNNIVYNTIVNNYINNSFIVGNQSNYGENYTNNYYFYNSQLPIYNNNLFSYNNNYNNSTTNNFPNYDNFRKFSPNIINKNNINPFNNINYKDNYSIAKNANYLVKNQFGCKLLQEKSLSDHKFVNELLFKEIRNNLKELCCNFICNCLIKTILDILNPSNIDLFLFTIKDSLYDISLTEPGSRIIQKLIEKICNYPILINKFIFYLANKNLGILFNSPYGNHVLQKYLSLIKKKEYTNFIYNYIYDNFLKISKEKYGICVIQKSLSEGDDEQKIKILEYIYINLEIIINDDYGNFLLQYIFTKYEYKRFIEILPIIIKIEKNIVEYCKKKNSASVIEKCFEKGDQQISEHLIKYLIDNHSNSLKDIIYNSYGFYVIKKSMYIKNKDIKEYIMKAIIENIDKIKEINNGKKIIESFSNEYKEFAFLLYLKNNQVNDGGVK